MTRIKALVRGVWRPSIEETPDLLAEFARHRRRFRHTVTGDGSSGFPAEAGRYRLYVSYACPWAHRTILYRKLKGLEESSRPGEFHPQALTDPDLSLSAHPAPTVQPVRDGAFASEP
jgi:putative glutathione S-transferase